MQGRQGKFWAISRRAYLETGTAEQKFRPDMLARPNRKNKNLPSENSSSTSVVHISIGSAESLTARTHSTRIPARYLAAPKTSQTFSASRPRTTSVDKPHEKPQPGHHSGPRVGLTYLNTASIC